MKNRTLSYLTRTYVLALSLIALLTYASFIMMHQLTLTQTDGARLVNSPRLVTVYFSLIVTRITLRGKIA